MESSTTSVPPFLDEGPRWRKEAEDYSARPVWGKMDRLRAIARVYAGQDLARRCRLQALDHAPNQIGLPACAWPFQQAHREKAPNPVTAPNREAHGESLALRPSGLNPSLKSARKTHPLVQLASSRLFLTTS